MTKLVWHRTRAYECPRCGHLASMPWKTCGGCDSMITAPLPSEPRSTFARLAHAIAAIPLLVGLGLSATLHVWSLEESR